jgi:hypothetical protein
MNQTPLPQWVDEAYSAELPVLRAQGEGPTLEYMAEFPSNATELAKEIAAFGSSDGGTILLGVSDAGELQGLEQLDQAASRDALIRRLEGVCHGQIKPSITPAAVFAVEEDRVVLVIRVPRGEQPVYYCHGKPYVRHLRQSRPAEPHEVIERVAHYLTLRSAVAVAAAPEDAPAQRRSQFLSSLATALRDLLLWADEAEARRVNPGLRDLMFQFGFAADELRVLASMEEAEDLDLASSLRSLSEKADAVAHHTHTLDGESRRAFLDKIDAARSEARRLWDAALKDVPLAEETRLQALEAVRQMAKQLKDLADRGQGWIDQGRLSELQAEVSGIGRRVTELAYLGLDEDSNAWVAEVRSLGHELHLVDMLRFTMGGREVAQLLELTSKAADRLAALPK